jgi:hypothetical protein
VLGEFLTRYKKDYNYCTELKEKGQRMMKNVEEKKIKPNQYILILERQIETVKNK